MKSSDPQDFRRKFYVVFLLVCLPLVFVGGVRELLKMYRTGDWTDPLGAIISFTLCVVAVLHLYRLIKSPRDYINTINSSTDDKKEQSMDHQ